MTPGAEISPTNPKRAKRKRLFSVCSAMKLTNYLVKKFREIGIEDDDDDSLPFKKRKISEDKINEEFHVGDFPLFVTDSLSNLKLREKECVQNVHKKKFSPLHVTISSKEFRSKQFIIIKKKSPEEIINQLNNIKQTSPEKRSKIRSAKLQLQAHKLKTTIIKENLVFDHTRFTTSIRSLIIRFEKSVNFVRPSRLQRYIDIDNIVRSFSIFGKGASIQDHWTRPKESWNQYPSVWLGATVTYRSTEDLNRVVKAFSLEKSPVICVPLLEHLSRINSVELEYIQKYQTSKLNGTTIVIENIYPRASRSKLFSEFELYGGVSNVKWIKLRDLNCSCEVTYITTTNAVAAALALDGKTVQQSLLRVKIKLTAREIFIHRKLCEMS